MSQQQDAPAPPKPTAEHEQLARLAGTWKADCAFYMDPSQPPMKVEATETVEAFGPFWILGRFEAEMFGAPFQGRSSMGFDPVSGKYVSTWQDTMAPQLYHFTGGYDSAGKVLEMSGEGVDCMSGGMTTYRTTEEAIGPDERVMEMFMRMPDGSEFKLFTHRYQRVR